MRTLSRRSLQTFFGVMGVALVLFISLSNLRAQNRPSSPAKLKIGFLMDSLQVERWQSDLNNFQKRAGELGAEVAVETAEGDDALQLQQAQKLLASGVKALVLVAHDTQKGVGIVNLAKDKRVPLLCYERLVRDDGVGVFVGVDVVEIGLLQAQSLTQLAPKGSYVLIAGSPSDINAKILHDAQMSVLKPLVDRGAIKIVADSWAKDWSPLEAYSIMSDAIAASNGNITAVVASNDGTAGGAIQALEEHKLAGKVLVSGQDADLAAIIRILQGTQTMTVYRPFRTQAFLAAETAVALAKGEDIRTSTTVSVGGRNIPAIYVSPIAVTKTNIMQTVIKDGFQNLGTIQKSLPKENWPQ